MALALDGGQEAQIRVYKEDDARWGLDLGDRRPLRRKVGRCQDQGRDGRRRRSVRPAGCALKHLLHRVALLGGDQSNHGHRLRRVVFTRRGQDGVDGRAEKVLCQRRPADLDAGFRERQADELSAKRP